MARTTIPQNRKPSGGKKQLMTARERRRDGSQRGREPWNRFHSSSFVKGIARARTKGERHATRQLLDAVRCGYTDPDRVDITGQFATHAWDTAVRQF